MPTQGSYLPLPSLEGYLSFQEAPLLSISPMTEAPAPCDESSESSGWIKRWCILEDGTINVYTDHTSAVARPEGSLRTIHLTRYQNLKSSVDYDANGSGRCELTLVDEMIGALQLPLQLPPKTRALPRSSTSASLSTAFERSASASQASVSKRQLPNLRPRQWSESTDSVNEKYQNIQSPTWSNKFATKSKRFYQLMASNISSQSLSEQGGRQTSDGGDGCSHILPSLASSTTLFGMSSSGSTVNNFTALRQQQSKPRYQPQQTASTLVLRPENARSMMEWAEAISRCLGASARVLRSPASLSVLPSHARTRRPRLTSGAGEEEDSSLYPLPNTTSSLVSAAMASRRKREDSAAKIIALKKELQKSSKQTSPSLPPSSMQASIVTVEQSKSLFNAIKSKRRASLEVFASALTGRKNSLDTTNSTGNSTRSSICCAGEAARMSWERSNRINNGTSITGTPPTSLAVFSQPFSNNRMIPFSSARRRSSIKSNHSSVQPFTNNNGPVAPSAFVAASMNESASYLEMNNSSSSAEDFQHSADNSNLPSPLSQGPRTPLTGDCDMNVPKLGWPKNNPNILGLNLYYDNFKDNNVGHETVLPSLPYRSFESQSVIVESPTREDLATLFGNHNNNQDTNTVIQEEKLSIVRAISPFERSKTKLAPSPSMPMLHGDFNTSSYKSVTVNDVVDEELEANVAAHSSLLTQLQANSMRFATFGKVVGRRPIQPKAIIAKTKVAGDMTSSSSTRSNLMSKHSPPIRVSSPLQRPSTSNGFRDPNRTDYFMNTAAITTATGEARSEGNFAPSNPKPVVERILPPEEMIATFDRLRSQSSMASLHQSFRVRPSISRPILVDMSYSSPQQQTRDTSYSANSRQRPSAMTAF